MIRPSYCLLRLGSCRTSPTVGIMLISNTVPSQNHTAIHARMIFRRAQSVPHTISLLRNHTNMFMVVIPLEITPRTCVSWRPMFWKWWKCPGKGKSTFTELRTVEEVALIAAWTFENEPAVLAVFGLVMGHFTHGNRKSR